MFGRLLDKLRRPKNRFSVEYLNYLHAVLVRNPEIGEGNRDLLVETLRQLAEVLIWGDQHNPEFFDFFLERNILGFFLSILGQKTGSQVKIQLLQTLSILIENIKDKNNVYFLLSNNHINDLITHKFDFSNEELLAYYVSLLKTLSLKLTPETVQFFFNGKASQRRRAAEEQQAAKGGGSGGNDSGSEISPTSSRTTSLSLHSHDFPLYTEAIKFFNHRETMIRIAVRTLTLNVYRVEDEAVRRFVLDTTAAPYFSNIVFFIREQCVTFSDMVSERVAVAGGHSPPTSPSGKVRSPRSAAVVRDYMAELQDFFYYMDDIFQLQIDELSKVLSHHLLKYLVLPQLVGSVPLGDSSIPLRRDGGETMHDFACPVNADEAVSPLVATTLLLQVLYIFKFKPLVNATACAALGLSSSSSKRGTSAMMTPRTRFRRDSMSAPGTKVDSAADGSKNSAEHETLPSVNDAIATHPRLKFVMDCVAGEAGPQGVETRALQVTGLCLLIAIVRNGGVDHEILRDAGLLPLRLARAKNLLKRLTTQNVTDAASPAGGEDTAATAAATVDEGSRGVGASRHRRTRSDMDSVVIDTVHTHTHSESMKRKGRPADASRSSLLHSQSFRRLGQRDPDANDDDTSEAEATGLLLRSFICSGLVKVMITSTELPGRLALMLLRELCTIDSGSLASGAQDSEYQLDDREVSNINRGFAKASDELARAFSSALEKNLLSLGSYDPVVVAKSHMILLFETAVENYASASPQVRRLAIDNITEQFDVPKEAVPPPLADGSSLAEVQAAIVKFLALLEATMVFGKDEMPLENEQSSTPDSSQSSSRRGSVASRGSWRGTPRSVRGLKGTSEFGFRAPSDFDSTSAAIIEAMREATDLTVSSIEAQPVAPTDVLSSSPPKSASKSSAPPTPTRVRTGTKLTEPVKLDPLSALAAADDDKESEHRATADAQTSSDDEHPENEAPQKPVTVKRYNVGDSAAVDLSTGEWIPCVIRSTPKPGDVEETPASPTTQKTTPSTSPMHRLRQKGLGGKPPKSPLAPGRQSRPTHAVRVLREAQTLVIARFNDDTGIDETDPAPKMCTVDRVVLLDTATYPTSECKSANQSATCISFDSATNAAEDADSASNEKDEPGTIVVRVEFVALVPPKARPLPRRKPLDKDSYRPPPKRARGARRQVVLLRFSETHEPAARTLVEAARNVQSEVVDAKWRKLMSLLAHDSALAFSGGLSNDLAVSRKFVALDRLNNSIDIVVSDGVLSGVDEWPETNDDVFSPLSSGVTFAQGEDSALAIRLHADDGKTGDESKKPHDTDDSFKLSYPSSPSSSTDEAEAEADTVDVLSSSVP